MNWIKKNNLLPIDDAMNDIFFEIAFSLIMPSKCKLLFSLAFSPHVQ